MDEQQPKTDNSKDTSGQHTSGNAQEQRPLDAEVGIVISIGTIPLIAVV